MHHDEGTLRGSSRGQSYTHSRSSLEPHSWHSGSCSVAGTQIREPFSSSGGGSRYECHRHRCCGAHRYEYRGRRPYGADTVNADRMRPAQTSVFSSTHGDFRQGHTGPSASASGGCISHFPNLSKNCERRSKSLDAAPIADCCHSGHPPALGSINEVILYGWYLMIPKNGSCSSGRTSTPPVAIGGYKTPEMLAGDFVHTAQIEQRLSRSKVRTRDGLEVVLVGMIDLSKSAGNGFSPALVNYFVMGFPPDWIYMILNVGSRTVNCSDSEVWPSPSPLEHPSQDVNINPADRTREERAHQPGNRIPFSTPAFASDGPGQEPGRAVATTLHGDGPSDMQADRRSSLNTDASGEMAQTKASSGMMTDGPPSGQKSDAAEGTATKVFEGSSQAQMLDLCGNCDPSYVQTDAAVTEMLKDTTNPPVENTNHTPDIPPLMETPKLAPGHGHGRRDSEEDVEVPRKSCPMDEAQVATDGVQSGKDSGDGTKTSALDDSTTAAAAIATPAGGLKRSVETNDDISRNESEASIMTSPQIPATPAKESGPLTQTNASIDFLVETAAAVTLIDPVGDVMVTLNCRKLRSGRQVSVVEKVVKEVPVNDATSGDTLCSNKSKKVNKRSSSRSQQLTRNEGERDGLSQGCKVMAVKTLAPTDDTAEHPDSLEQIPCTPSKTSRKRSRSVESNLQAPNPVEKRHKTPLFSGTLEHSEGRRTRKSECCLQLTKKPTKRKQSENFQSPSENGKSRMKLRSSSVAPLAPVPREPLQEPAVSSFATNCEVETHSSNATVKESVEVYGLPDMNRYPDDSAISSRGVDEVLEESDDGPRLPLTRKRRRKGFFYSNRRRKPEPKSCSPDQSGVSCKADCPQSKPCSARPNGTKEKTPKQKKEGLIVEQSRKGNPPKKATKSAGTSDPTLQSTRKGRKQVQTKKEKSVRNSIIPPPLPPPRVADKSKVTEAFGLKKSRCGRVIVPPLAVWCNQSIKYDADGSIIAISDGFPLEDECGTGSKYNFPSSKSARTLQRKFRKAAQIVWSKK